jgi:hypothetical protein
MVEAAMPEAADATSQAHLADLRTQIRGILDGSGSAGQ